MRSEMEEAKKKIGELDGKINKLNNLIDRAKKEKVAQDQDVSVCWVTMVTHVTFLRYWAQLLKP